MLNSFKSVWFSCLGITNFIIYFEEVKNDLFYNFYLSLLDLRLLPSLLNIRGVQHARVYFIRSGT